MTTFHYFIATPPIQHNMNIYSVLCLHDNPSQVIKQSKMPILEGLGFDLRGRI